MPIANRLWLNFQTVEKLGGKFPLDFALPGDWQKINAESHK
jgi:hypothetical protein